MGAGGPSSKNFSAKCTSNTSEAPSEQDTQPSTPLQQRRFGPPPQLALRLYIQLWKDYLVENEACEDPEVKRQYEKLLAHIKFHPHPGFSTETKQDLEDEMWTKQLKAALSFWNRYGQYQEDELSKGLEDLLEDAQANGGNMKPSIWEDYVYAVERLQKMVRVTEKYP